jgi:hypothetical protein
MPLKESLHDIHSIDSLIHTLILKNPLGCSPYHSAKKFHPPVERVREIYTAKFAYLDPTG